MEDQAYSYSWHGSSRTPSKALSKTNTPSRSTRRSGYLNLTHYNAFTRSDGIKFEVGDVVQIWEGVEYTPAQVWLDPYKRFGGQSVQSLRRQQAAAAERGEEPEAGPSTSRGLSTPRKRTGRASRAQIAQRASEDDSEDWIPDDGLEDAVKFAVIIDLFEDEQENMRVAVHWLARPRLLCYFHGKHDSVEEGLHQCHPRELIYTFDPTEDSTKHKTSKPSSSEDIIDVSYVLNPIQILSYGRFEAQEGAAAESTYFIRKAMNVKLDLGEGWYFDIDWQVVYEKARASGNWELKTASSKAKQTPKTKGKRTTSKGKETVTKSAKKRQKIVKSLVKEVAGDIPKNRRVADGEESRRSSRASSVETDLVDESDLDSSSDDVEEDAHTDADFRSDRASDEENDDDDDFDLDIPSSSEDEAPKVDEESDYEDVDVFGSRNASARKRKAGVKGSPGKRAKGTVSGGRRNGRYDADVGDEVVVLRPSAATLRKNAALAERRQQRLAERQARRLQPRLPLVQQRYIGLEGGDSSMSPFEKARTVLHVGCTPDYLPCRDEEYAEVEAYLEDAIDEGIGSCIYIAGVPGTGKTATVRSVISSLQQRAGDKEIKPFRFLEINGMKITDPAQSFTILWEFISGHRSSAKQALSSLETHFKTPSPNRDTCVVLVDELDQLVTKKQEVIYNFFNWPNQPHSRLIVLAIANTMDLPERELSNKINSRLGSNRINFTPYDKNQLIEILTNRLEGLESINGKGGVFAKDAIGLVAGKVAGVTGDARRALDICRRAVEKVEAENMTRVQEGKEPRLVNAGDIVVVHKEMTSSGLLLYVKRAGLHQRIMLLALSRAIRKLGVADEVEFGDIIRWHIDFCRQTAIQPLPTHSQLFSVLQSLADMKLLTMEGGSHGGARLDYFQRVQANVRDDELELVFRKEQRFSHYLR